MLVKVSELKGVALDWAVATAEKEPIKLDPMGFWRDAPKSSQCGYWIWDDTNGFKSARFMLIGGDYSPSTDWKQGGDIIEKSKINLIYTDDQWEADTSADCFGFGGTALKAAMRCYVISKLGEEIDLPQKLCND